MEDPVGAWGKSACDPIPGVVSAIQTFDCFVKCPIYCHVWDLVYSDTLKIWCIRSFQKRFSCPLASGCSSDRVSFGEKILTKNTCNVAIDTCYQNGLAIAR